MFDDEDLLDRALDALARGGYRSLSMRGLARELGVSLASVQHRYPTKDDLWRAAVDRMLGDETRVIVDRPFPDAVRERMAQSAERPSLLFALLSDDAPGREERLAYIAARLRPALDEANELFDTVRELGLTRDVDINVLVALMLIGVGALAALPEAVTKEFDLGPDPAERLAAGFADIVLNGILVRD